jgi:hypothetical protein
MVSLQGHKTSPQSNKHLAINQYQEKAKYDESFLKCSGLKNHFLNKNMLLHILIPIQITLENLLGRNLEEYNLQRLQGHVLSLTY